MSSKSAAHSTPRTHSFFTRKVIVITIIAVAVMFLLTVVKYPLIFGPEKSASDVPAPPTTEVR